MDGRRAVIDYSLQRRARLSTLARGGAVAREDACDADPYLRRAALAHGEPVAELCPVCAGDGMRLLTYVFGEELGQYSGRIRAPRDLPALARSHGELRVCVVEVCPACRWNHLRVSYVVGDGVRRRPPRRAHVVSDDD